MSYQDNHQTRHLNVSCINAFISIFKVVEAINNMYYFLLVRRSMYKRPFMIQRLSKIDNLHKITTILKESKLYNMIMTKNFKNESLRLLLWNISIFLVQEFFSFEQYKSCIKNSIMTNLTIENTIIVASLLFWFIVVR